MIAESIIGEFDSSNYWAKLTTQVNYIIIGNIYQLKPYLNGASFFVMKRRKILGGRALTMEMTINYGKWDEVFNYRWFESDYLKTRDYLIGCCLKECIPQEIDLTNNETYMCNINNTYMVEAEFNDNGLIIQYHHIFEWYEKETKYGIIRLLRRVSEDRYMDIFEYIKESASDWYDVIFDEWIQSLDDY